MIMVTMLKEIKQDVLESRGRHVAFTLVFREGSLREGAILSET